jgi:hypothetical protein
MLEIGVWRGEFAAYMLRNAPSITRYYMIDPWRHLERWNKPFNVASEELEQARRDAMDAVAFARDKVEVLRGTTLEVIDRIPDESIDLAYVDGDHTLRGITTDLISVYSKIRSGGYIGGDDFDPEIWHHGPKFEPTLVFPFALYFSEAVGAELWALDHGQFIMQKPMSGRQFAFHDERRIYQHTELLPLISQVARTSFTHRALRRGLRMLSVFRSR